VKQLTDKIPSFKKNRNLKAKLNIKPGGACQLRLKKIIIFDTNFNEKLSSQGEADVARSASTKQSH
jgi:hypothetical protein